MAKTNPIVAPENVESRILVVRGQKVILDRDLAELYGVETKRLKEQVKRNEEKLPDDFAFVLAPEEVAVLRSQFATSNGRGGTRYAPMVFTEYGALMAANVLRSPKAIAMSIFIVRAFVRLRRSFEDHVELAKKLDALERKYDAQFKVVFDAIRALMSDPKPKRKQIGFHAEGRTG